jgi:serine/threonine protein kinase KIN1/2
MLVTDPKQRATLAEIMNHPWMTKGFNTTPENFLPPREPLQLPLDAAVIQRMTGFDFGSPEYITEKLTKVLESDDYQRAVKLASRKHAAQTPEAERKRDIFTFYKRRNSTTSRDTLTNPSSEQIPVGQDPTNAYSPYISIYYLVREKMEREAQEENPGALGITGEKAPAKMPDLAAPEAAYTNPQTYEMAGEAPTGGRARPRARTHGEDEVTEGLQKINLKAGENAPAPAVVSPTHEQPPKKEGLGILRRFSTRRRREPEREAQAPPPAVNVSSPIEATGQAPKQSFSVRRAREAKPKAPSTASLQVDGSQRHQPELLTPPSAGNQSFPKRFMSLRRSTSVDRRRLGKRGVSEGTHPEPPATSGSDGSSMRERTRPGGDAASDDLQPRPRTSAARAKSLGHARRESIQARRINRERQKESNVPEETDAELVEQETHDEREDVMKPVYLKGLFSVSTTSSKPLPVIRADIIRVLKQLGVEYTEIKGGFSCRHAPSIDMQNENQKLSAEGPLSPAPPAAEKGHRRKISFGGLRSSDRDREDFREKARSDDYSLRPPPTPRTPGRSRGGATGTGQDASLTATDVDTSESEGGHVHQRLRKQPAVARNPGETTTHVRDDVGESMALKFEIVIVKVPILSLHGIQFKKVDGNMMHYKNMAQEILKGLKL